MIKKYLNKLASLFNSKIISLLQSINKNLSYIVKQLRPKDEEQKALCCKYEDNDELKIYQGYDIIITDGIKIHVPLLREINEYGEKAYYSMVYTLCSVGADLKWQLDDIGVDYTQIDDFELFYSLLSRSYSKEQTRILFGDVLDFSEMQLMYNNNLQENVLVQFFDDETYIQIDRYVYNAIVSTLRKIHRIKRNDEIPGNEATRQILIEDARDEYEENKNKPAKPYLLPLVSAMVNSTGFKRDDKSVFGMNIYAFMDSVARISKIKNSELLLQSGYSGFGIDLKKVNSDETNWLGELS